MVLLGAPRGDCRALVMLGWDNLSVTQFIVTPARLRWVLKSRTPVPPAALSVRSRSLKMWDQEHRRQRVQSKQNKSVCLSAGWGVLYSSGCFETQDRGCSLCCWNVHALHLQCLKLTKQEKIDFRAQVNIDSSSKCFKQSYSFSSPEQEFPISDSWSLENGTAQLWHLSSHTATAQQDHSHVLLPNPPLPTCLQAKEFQNKAQHVTGWLICLGNVIFPIWCTLEEWSHLKRGGIAQPSTLWQFSHN